MTTHYWRWLSAVAIGWALGCWFGPRLAGQPVESSWGHDVPEIVGMTGESYVLIEGEVEAAQHEAIEGYFNIGRLSISVPPQGIPAGILRQLDAYGKRVEVVVRVVKPRQVEQVRR